MSETFLVLERAVQADLDSIARLYAEIGALIRPEDERAIREAFDALGGANLSGVRERLGGYDFGLLRIYRAARLQRGDDLIDAVVEAD